MSKKQLQKTHRKAALENDSASLPTHQAALSTPVAFELQRTIGNQAMQRLLKDHGGSSPLVQRSIWDPLTDIWNTVTDTASSIVKQVATANPPTASPKPAAEGDIRVVTDKDALVRTPPPELDNTGARFTHGRQVKIHETLTQNGKSYVLAEEILPEGMISAPLMGWTRASNLKGGTSTPAGGSTSDTPVTPAPASGSTPGLPAMPEITHESFTAIIAELERMEQNPAPVGRMSEEQGEERKQRVTDIGNVRASIAGLSAAALGVPETELKAAQTYLYRRLAPLAPYAAQYGNANMMASSSSKAWDRTCNVTVPAMVLEGLGKSMSDYTGDVDLLRRIFGALEGKYLAQVDSKETLSDFDSLRFADLLQLIAIARQIKADDIAKEGDEFAKAVEKARQKAAAATTAHKTIVALLEAFGASTQEGYVHTSELNTIGGARRAYTWEQLQKATTGRYKNSEEKREAMKTQYESVDADELLSVETYRATALKKIKPHLDSGAQILVGMENHFNRLDAMDEEHIQVDDPGRKNFKNLKVTWAQARDMGYFKKFWAVK